MDGQARLKPLPQERPQPGEEEYLAELIRLKVEPAPLEVLLAAESGPLEPESSLPRGEVDRLCDPAPLENPHYWSRMQDLSVRVSNETPMPDLSREMIEWWFDWHSRRSQRYRVWHPVAHFANGRAPAAQPAVKPYWGVSNFPVEDVGDGAASIRIDFTSPREFGFTDDYLDDDSVATIVCARVGDRLIEHTFMAHVFLRDGDGLRLRSHFWIAEKVRPRLPGPASVMAGPIQSLVSNRYVRKVAVPDQVGRTLLVHCSEEYQHLNRILPGLYERFA